MTEFIFITRPNELVDRMVLSESQKEKVAAAFRQNPDRVAKSMTLQAAFGDRVVQEQIKASKADKERK